MLASTLASSLLQLYKTPWLSETWSKKDITFLRCSSSFHQPVDIEQLFVIANSGATRKEEKLNYTSENDANSSLLALGFMLLELGLSQPVERQQRPEDSYYFMTARRLIRQQEDNLTQAFTTHRAVA